MANTNKNAFSRNVEDLEKALGVTFSNKDLLRTALTHRSYSHEHGDAKEYNERLEFLGDAALSLVVNEYLFVAYPDLPEGKLAKIKSVLVSDATLAGIAKRYALGEYARLGKGEERSGGRVRPALLEDMFEATVGAIYLDKGFSVMREFVLRAFKEKFDDIEGEGFFSDYKTKLQEWAQKQWRITPEYRLVKESGPNHERVFSVEVWVNKKKMGEGVGRNKKEAEQRAAHAAYRGIDAR